MTKLRAVVLGCWVAGLAILYVYSGYRVQNDDTRWYYRTSGAVLGRPTWIAADEYPVGTPAHEALVKAGGGMMVPVKQQVPYRDFEAEYPPAALGIFLLPRMVTDDPNTYVTVFAWLMGAALAAAAWAGGRILRKAGGAQGALMTYAVGCVVWLLAAGPLTLMRYDPVVIAAVAWGLVMMLQRRWAWCGGLLGLAVALKVWPVFLAGPLMFWMWREGRWQGLLTAWGTAAAVEVGTHVAVMPWVGGAVWNYLVYHGDRGLQIESVPALLAALVARAKGWQVAVTSGFGSDQLSLPGHDVRGWVLGSYVAMVLGNLACWWAGWRAARAADGPAVRIMAVAAATIGLLILSAKVFSVQYGFWLFPMVLVMTVGGGERRRILGWVAAAAYVAALGMAHWWYPVHFAPIMGVTGAGLALLAVRDGLILLMAGIAWRIAGANR